MSVKYWTESFTNWNGRRCRYPPMKCTAWNRYCSAARRTEALVKWYPSTVARLSSFHSNDDRRVDNRGLHYHRHGRRRRGKTERRRQCCHAERHLQSSFTYFWYRASQRGDRLSVPYRCLVYDHLGQYLQPDDPSRQL